MELKREELDNKPDPAILLRFSTEELWKHFIFRICRDCEVPEDKCDSVVARKCFDEWISRSENPK
jgi:hypothetical protein